MAWLNLDVSFPIFKPPLDCEDRVGNYILPEVETLDFVSLALLACREYVI